MTLLPLTAEELLTTTRSVRKRLDLTRPVDLDLVREALTVALQAPSGSNRQGWHFVVVTDPAKRAALYIRMNDLVVGDNNIIPLISRPRVRGGNLKLVTTLSGWDLDFSALQNWYREA